MKHIEQNKDFIISINKDLYEEAVNNMRSIVFSSEDKRSISIHDFEAQIRKYIVCFKKYNPEIASKIYCYVWNDIWADQLNISFVSKPSLPFDGSIKRVKDLKEVLLEYLNQKGLIISDFKSVEHDESDDENLDAIKVYMDKL